MTGTKVSYRGTDAAEAVTALTAEPLRARTFGGDDDVFGSLLADHLDAGDGDDRVRARDGRDTCVDAERATSCER